MVYFHGIISGSPTWHRFIADKAGITDTTYVYPEFLMIIITPTFSGLFTYAINGTRFHNSVLGRIVHRGIWAEYRNTRWPKNLIYFFLLCQVQDIEKRVHVQVPGPHRKFFSSGTQHRGH